MNIEEFYTEDERRRQSDEVELGDSWTDSSDPELPTRSPGSMTLVRSTQC
jgi:hypothetical protein